MKVVKRDGINVEDFCPEKIESAILRANNDVNEEEVMRQMQMNQYLGNEDENNQDLENNNNNKKEENNTKTIKLINRNKISHLIKQNFEYLNKSEEQNIKKKIIINSYDSYYLNEKEDFNCPEELHFYYIRTIQKGKINENKF